MNEQKHNKRRTALAIAALGAVLVMGIGLILVGLGSAPQQTETVVGGVRGLTVTRSCDFVTFEGKTYIACDDGVTGTFEELDQDPFEEMPVESVPTQ